MALIRPSNGSHVSRFYLALCLAYIRQYNSSLLRYDTNRNSAVLHVNELTLSPFIELKRIYCAIMSATRRSLRPSETKWYLVQKEDTKVFIFKNNKQLKAKDGQDFGEICNISTSRTDVSDEKLKVSV